MTNTEARELCFTFSIPEKDTLLIISHEKNKWGNSNILSFIDNNNLIWILKLGRKVTKVFFRF